MSAPPREGLYATIYVCPDSGTVGPGSVIGMLTGVELSWAQNKRRFYQLGTLTPINVLDGVITYDGAFRHAYQSNVGMGAGTRFYVGTVRYIGSICPRGTSPPAIMGTLAFTGGNIRNLSAESSEASIEENTFILYNVSFYG